ncbi:MAG: hypothetical protein JRN54_02805 [Nitrososphaerota archaeon]|jgi:hypothetical protein|nr:hypothetical protein [Nitrososphaerota archaeon]
MKRIYPATKVKVLFYRARRHLFKPTEADIEEMKREHEPLERASLEDLRD